MKGKISLVPCAIFFASCPLNCWDAYGFTTSGDAESTSGALELTVTTEIGEPTPTTSGSSATTTAGTENSSGAVDDLGTSSSGSTSGPDSTTGQDTGIMPEEGCLKPNDVSTGSGVFVRAGAVENDDPKGSISNPYQTLGEAADGLGPDRQYIFVCSTTPAHSAGTVKIPSGVSIVGVNCDGNSPSLDGTIASLTIGSEIGLTFEGEGTSCLVNVDLEIAPDLQDPELRSRIGVLAHNANLALKNVSITTPDAVDGLSPPPLVDLAPTAPDGNASLHNECIVKLEPPALPFGACAGTGGKAGRKCVVPESGSMGGGAMGGAAGKNGKGMDTCQPGMNGSNALQEGEPGVGASDVGRLDPVLGYVGVAGEAGSSGLSGGGGGGGGGGPNCDQDATCNTGGRGGGGGCGGAGGDGGGPGGSSIAIVAINTGLYFKGGVKLDVGAGGIGGSGADGQEGAEGNPGGKVLNDACDGGDGGKGSDGGRGGGGHGGHALGIALDENSKIFTSEGPSPCKDWAKGFSVEFSEAAAAAGGKGGNKGNNGMRQEAFCEFVVQEG